MEEYSPAVQLGVLGSVEAVLKVVGRACGAPAHEQGGRRGEEYLLRQCRGVPPEALAEPVVQATACALACAP